MADSPRRDVLYPVDGPADRQLRDLSREEAEAFCRAWEQFSPVYPEVIFRCPMGTGATSYSMRGCMTGWENAVADGCDITARNAWDCVAGTADALCSDAGIPWPEACMDRCS
jgi:hypothetical protein